MYGAYSELYAAFSPDLTTENNGGYILAWGRIDKIPDDITKAMKDKKEGGAGGALRFWDYCERETNSFV